MVPKPTLEVAKYEGLVTVFALMLAVEYATGFYDLWDIFIGLLSIYLGFAVYWKYAKENNDFLYSSLTVCLISLGFVAAITGCIFVIAALFGHRQPYEEKFWIENVRFIIFCAIALGLYKILNRQNTRSNPMQPTGDAVAD